MSWVITGSQKINWTPLTASAALWFDASDASTIDESSSAVSEWRDKSGNNRHLAQANTGNQPTLTANALNSMPAIVFDGADDFLQSTAAGCDGVNNVTFVAVMRHISVTGSDMMFGLGTSGNPRRTRAIFRSADIMVMDMWTINAVASTLNYDTGGSFRIFSFEQRESIVNFLRDGTSDSGNPRPILPNLPLPINSNTATMGSLGGGSIASFYSNIAMSELIALYDPSASDNLVQKAEGYLAHKWGLTANLPNDHPYKVNVPTP
jgi:hypothetical protein